MTPEQHEALRAEWKALQEAGPPPVDRVMLSEPEFLAKRSGMSFEQLCELYRVPPELLSGLQANATRSIEE